MSDFADLANEIEEARNSHLNSFGSSPDIVAKKRSILEQILRNDVFTIIEALRIAAKARASKADNADHRTNT